MKKAASSFYFSRYEHRSAPAPLESGPLLMAAWKFFAICALTLGAWYLHWRWTASINTDALWFSVPMILAETFSWFGLILFIYNLWDVKDYPKQPPPHHIGDCEPTASVPNRPISVDVFICTFSEDEELVRLSIKDACAMHAPNGVNLKIHVLDDGSRQEMRRVASEEGANYISREENIGFKAGNLRNGMEHTSGDFIVICDADTRLFPTFLEQTLGYFRDPDVAFVQTPQWFFDTAEGESLNLNWNRRFGKLAGRLAALIERITGQITVGADPFVNDALIFYDILQRRRNRVNAAFCCGAGSIHRREAVMAVALREWSNIVASSASLPHSRRSRRGAAQAARVSAATQARWKTAQATELTPYKFHVSEDLYSTIVLHQDRIRRWKTVMHPEIQSKMLSPQDLLTWTVQRFKYAGGSIDIFINDNPILKPGLSFGQRIMYLSTFWSYISSIWILMFIFAPIMYLFSGVGPVSSYSRDFFYHLLPFLVSLEIAMMLGHWGRSGHVSKVMALASVNLPLQALWTVMRGKKISFPVTPKVRQEGNFLALVWPQRIAIFLGYFGFIYAVGRLYLDQQGILDTGHTLGGLIANGVFVIYNNSAFRRLVNAARWQPPPETLESTG